MTVRALMRLDSGAGTGPGVEVWRGRINASRIAVGDDKASVREVQAVYEPRMYWNHAAGF